MEVPRARVILVPLHDEVAVRLNGLHVAPLWILRVYDGTIPLTRTFGEDESSALSVLLCEASN